MILASSNMTKFLRTNYVPQQHQYLATDPLGVPITAQNTFIIVHFRMKFTSETVAALELHL